MNFKTNVIIFSILILSFSIINYFIFNPSITHMIKIEKINVNQNKIFNENDKIFSNFFDETNNLKYIFKYKSFIRIKKFNNKNNFEIISSDNLNIDNLLNDLNIYREKNSTKENKYNFKLTKTIYNNVGLHAYIFQFFIILLLLFILSNVTYEKK